MPDHTAWPPKPTSTNDGGRGSTAAPRQAVDGVSPGNANAPVQNGHLRLTAAGAWVLGGRLAERQHQPVGPVEERRGMDHVGDRQFVQPGATQALHMLRSER